MITGPNINRMLAPAKTKTQALAQLSLGRTPDSTSNSRKMEPIFIAAATSPPLLSNKTEKPFRFEGGMKLRTNDSNRDAIESEISPVSQMRQGRSLSDMQSCS